ncbi:MAG: tetratricopeptide repeat protein, partial [Bdellovibrionaceae bacterium]|nr:tetratricopeptide repeat protein [Pseudobdellovibrionaceae bacterium]
FYENAKPQEAYQLLQKIEKPLALSEGEQVERVRLASRLYEAKGDNGTAIRYLKELGQLWQGDPKLSVPVLFKLAAMQIQEKDVNSAIQTYERCKDILLQGKDSSEADLARLADSYAQVLVENKRSKEAITMLNEVIEKYDQLPFNEQRYLLGDLYFKNGETKKADVVWQKIKDNDNNVWKSLSQEKLKQAAWDVNYKKHLKRIPAMSLLEESK